MNPRATVRLFALVVPLALTIGMPDASARRIVDRTWSPFAPQLAEGHLHAEFTTHFKVRQYDRSANVRRAALRLHGVELGPYQKLSYNRIVGPRTLDAGFRKAPVIDQGKLVKDLGGGVCQPSSTLHAAALLAGMRIVERKPHTWTSNYIATGLDAAVAWGMKDLVIKNPWPFTIRIAVEVADTYVTMRIYGDEPARASYELEAEITRRWPHDTVEEQDDALPAGTEKLELTGLDGLRLERRLIKRIDGRTHSLRIPDDTYYKRSRIVLRGPPRTADIEPAPEAARHPRIAAEHLN